MATFSDNKPATEVPPWDEIQACRGAGKKMPEDRALFTYGITNSFFTVRKMFSLPPHTESFQVWLLLSFDSDMTESFLFFSYKESSSGVTGQDADWPLSPVSRTLQQSRQPVSWPMSPAKSLSPGWPRNVRSSGFYSIM